MYTFSTMISKEWSTNSRHWNNKRKKNSYSYGLGDWEDIVDYFIQHSIYTKELSCLSATFCIYMEISEIGLFIFLIIYFVRAGLWI